MIIGVDVGTQSLKVAVLDDQLRIRRPGARCYRPSYPKPGWVEQAPDLWTDALGPAIAEALQSAQVPRGAISARSAFCGQLDGCIAVDSDGKRAVAVPDLDGSARHGGDRRRTGGSRARASAAWCSTRATWREGALAEAPPDAGDAPIARFHQPVSYMVEQLTGVAVIDHALASTSMLYSLDRRGYDPALLARFELARAAIAADRRGGEPRRHVEPARRGADRLARGHRRGGRHRR